MPQLFNKAVASGEYGEVGTTHFSELSVELEAIKVEKTADKPVWMEDELTYTIVVTNLDNRDPDDDVNPGLPIVGITLTDTIDTNIAILDTATIKINGATAVEDQDYTYTGGVLTFISLQDLAPSNFHTITFQVNRVQP